MKRDIKRVLILSLKIGVGSAIAIILAYFFKLDNPTSAGTIALLSLLTTKWGTMRLVLRRISTFFVTILFCFIFFELIPSHWIAFGLVIACLVGYSEKMKCQNTLSVNAMIAVHYLSYLDFSLHFMMNEFYLILIGAIIAFLLNLVHDYSGEEEYLNSCMIYMEDKIQSLMYQIVHYIQSEERNTTIWKELEDIKEQAEKYIHIAMEYQDNTFTNLPDYYIRYFEMRALQCDILHMLHYKIRKIREMPKEAHELANYIEYLIPFIHEKNDPQPQISSLHKMLKDKQSEALPESRIEFESKAMLLHIYMDLEEFLYTKKKFIDQTTEEQKKLYWR